MTHARSADGTRIAYERLGSGPPLIVVGGALCDAAKMRPTAKGFAEHGFTAINYDRRGRGASTDTQPYAVAREIEDLHALVEAAGGSAAVYGHSSGAGLVLEAVAAGLPVTAYVLHEPPYSPDSPEQRTEAAAYVAEIEALIREDRRSDAVAAFMRLTGMPDEVIDASRGEQWWRAAEAMAPTLLYESAVMGDEERGGTVPHETLNAITGDAPALVLVGGASPDWFVDTAQEIADALPDARCAVLENEDHVVAPETLAPIVAEFVLD
jgi:pimeloyl-ACP methyl ester carboxylesterase